MRFENRNAPEEFEIWLWRPLHPPCARAGPSVLRAFRSLSASFGRQSWAALSDIWAVTREDSVPLPSASQLNSFSPLFWSTRIWCQDVRRWCVRRDTREWLLLLFLVSGSGQLSWISHHGKVEKSLWNLLDRPGDEVEWEVEMGFEPSFLDSQIVSFCSPLHTPLHCPELLGMGSAIWDPSWLLNFSWRSYCLWENIRAWEFAASFRSLGCLPRRICVLGQVIELLQDSVSSAINGKTHHCFYWSNATTSKKEFATSIAWNANAPAGDGHGGGLNLPGWSPLAGDRGQGRGIWAAPSCVGWEEPARRQGLLGIGSCGPAGRWSPKWATSGSALWICTLTLPSPVTPWLLVLFDFGLTQL